MIGFIRFSVTLLLGLLWLALGISSAMAAEHAYLEVSPSNSEDLNALFTELEQSLEGALPDEDPVVVVLHGDEALSFTSSGYRSNRELVDRAARLDAYRLIDVKMCETWMKENGIDPGEIPAFIETIPYAPEEIDRLKSEGYVPRESVRL